MFHAWDPTRLYAYVAEVVQQGGSARQAIINLLKVIQYLLEDLEGDFSAIATADPDDHK